jgi:uncharacterized protein (TIGR02757 family)
LNTTINRERLVDFLNEKVDCYNQPSFIASDPVCIPHMFQKKQDIEIAGLFAAVFAWGNRTTIINKSRELLQLMDMAPYDFCINHQDQDLKKLLQFKHRTFNVTDLLYFIEFLKFHYSKNKSLESAFFSAPIIHLNQEVKVEHALIHFHNYFFSLEEAPNRTRKHIATPYKQSSCKRLNMYLRWMVRNDKKGVDFGIWKKIQPADLICPIDVHVARVAKRFQLLDRKQVDWNAAIELTSWLRELDPVDPVKYDFALFGLGVIEKYT